MSGSIFCDGFGWKMRKASAGGGGYICGYHNRFGKNYCSTHYINRELIEGIILSDIQEMCKLAKDERHLIENYRMVSAEKKSALLNISDALNK